MPGMDGTGPNNKGQGVCYRDLCNMHPKNLIDTLMAQNSPSNTIGQFGQNQATNISKVNISKSEDGCITINMEGIEIKLNTLMIEALKKFIQMSEGDNNESTNNQ